VATLANQPLLLDILGLIAVRGPTLVTILLETALTVLVPSVVVVVVVERLGASGSDSVEESWLALE
jgi:hypothetical protein